MPQEDITIEKNLALELLSYQHERKPQTIVSPHPVIWNLRERGPHRDGFLGFLGLPVTVRGGKDIH